MPEDRATVTFRLLEDHFPWLASEEPPDPLLVFDAICAWHSQATRVRPNIAAELEHHFQWLKTDQPATTIGVVSELCQWYEDLRDEEIMRLARRRYGWDHPLCHEDPSRERRE